MVDTIWSEGYVTDTGYSHGYCSLLNPLSAEFTMLIEGLSGPPPGPCCELGFGQGLSIAIHAAAQPSRAWWGTDFNPAHVANAQELVQASGVQAHIAEQSFAEFCTRDDLPDFAFIGLHGVWSWVSDANRQLIVDFLRRKLMTGGVAMISYNMLPGWANMLPLRDVLLQHARWVSPTGRAEAQQLHAALEFATQLFALDPITLRNHPSLLQQLQGMREQPYDYLIHEYMTRDWKPQMFSDLSQQLAQAKLSFACSAQLLDRVAELHVTSAQKTLIDSIEHAAFRETVRDWITENRFRVDLWSRGARRMNPIERLRRIESARVVLGIDKADVPTFMSGQHGNVRLPASALSTVLDALATADRPTTLGELLGAAVEQGTDLDTTLSTIAMLVGMGAVYPAQNDDEASAAREATDRLNSHLLRRATEQGDIKALVSPVSAGGIPLSPAHQGLIAAYRSDDEPLEAWVLRVWENLLDNGGQVQDEAGKAVTEPEAALALLRPLAEQVRMRWLPALRRLQVVG
ncbi:MAG: class I SAM-dependent methyltransferase [Burkholderiales bacterium]